MNDLVPEKLRELMAELGKRASKNDITFRLIEAGLLLVSGVSLAVAGMIYQTHFGLSMLALLIGIVLGVLNLVLSSKQKHRETGPLAEAVIAKAEALAITNAAKLEAQAAQKNLTDMTAERDAARSSCALADARITELAGQIAGEQDLILAWKSRWRAMLVALGSMNKAAEIAPANMELIPLLESMFDSSQMVLEDAFDFESREKWTLSIFSREIVGGKPRMVRRVARARDPEERKDNRDWGMGEGFTGDAWHQGEELIVSDRTDPDFAEKFHDADPARKAKDLKLYVSFAVIPITIGTDIVGTITATSDKRHSFLSNPTDPRALNAELLRQIAGIVAVQIAMRRTPQQTTFKSP